MTLKNFVLDALSKFWNKLKGSYITPMQTQLGDLRGTQISMISNVDANDYQDAGVFQVGDPSTVSNLPSGVTYGILIVTHARSYRYQEYYECGSPHAVYQRRSTDSGVTWGVWLKRLTLNDAPFLGIGGTEITSNQDLDSFKDVGNYFCKGNATAATLTNCPTTQAFKMYVTRPTGGSEAYVGQIIHEFSGLIVYYRWYGVGDSTWRAWNKLAPVSGAASTVATSNLTASRALISDTSGKIGVSSVTTTELGYLSGVTSAIQTQINGKQASITGGASTITSSNLTASRALISNASGKVAVSAVTSTELGYLDGVTSAVQTQLNGKVSTSVAGAQYYGGYKTVTNSSAANVWVKSASTITLPAGTYLLGIWAQNETSTGQVVKVDNDSQNLSNVEKTIYVPPGANSCYSRAGSMFPMSISASTVFSAYVTKGVATSLNIKVECYAVRLK